MFNIFKSYHFTYTLVSFQKRYLFILKAWNVNILSTIYLICFPGNARFTLPSRYLLPLMNPILKVSQSTEISFEFMKNFKFVD